MVERRKKIEEGVVREKEEMHRWGFKMIEGGERAKRED